MQAYVLREKFLGFFKGKKHKVIESDSLVPKDDPTVLFTPAGMNQFKKEFLGVNSGFIRAASAQRCLRTDDLDKVGKTSGHHTFFEMLGNFSFGDYFKQEAIQYAWEFLVDELKIDRRRLWVSVYQEDAEAYKIWKELIKVPAEKILKLGDKENFWPSEAKSKGPNGPCGPCSEIFFDQGQGQGKERLLEVWNLVFTQYNRKAQGKLEPLPKKNIDTGMGLERLACVMQGKSNNFETDLFQPLVKEIISGVGHRVEGQKESVYAIADHIRAVSFAIYDGVLASNESRGYVVRKLIRKSSSALRTLGLNQPFLYRLVPVVADTMPYYPELKQRKENISEIILSEEKNFLSTLNSSDSLMQEKFHRFFKHQDPEEVGAIAFSLYDTYGIPFELTASWLEKHGLNIAKEAFDRAMSEQKNRSKLQSSMKGDVFAVQELETGVAETKFLGYKEDSTKAKILKIITDTGESKKINRGQNASIILDKTVFYPESGGQAGDTGELIKGGNVFEVTDTKRIGRVILHIGKVKYGVFKKNGLLSAKFNYQRRMAIARNHTATHLLQAALRKVLGEHVQQQGSLVAEEKLRFDFTHFKDIDAQQLERIEEVVYDYIIGNYPVTAKQMLLSAAKKTGALAFFAEKYEKNVRVISIGDLSKELCAGTHLNATGAIGIFKIIQEGSVASGIRRIEAVTGTFALMAVKNEEERLRQELEKANSLRKEAEKKLSSQKLSTLNQSLDDLIKDAETINGIKVITGCQPDLGIDLLRRAVDLAREKEKNSQAIVALGSQAQGRALLVLGITPDLAKKGLDASELIRGISKFIGGSGGGRKDFAQAGGNKPEELEIALAELKNMVRNLS